MNKENLKVFSNLDLIPDEWKGKKINKFEWYVFNPTIAELNGFYTISYRVVDQVNKTRRIASCMLNKDFEIIPESVVPISDYIVFEDQELSERSKSWHADPRYFQLSGDLYLFWNDGSVKPANNQFIVKIDKVSLLPKGKAKLVFKKNTTPRIEKNWQFFNSGGLNYIIYENNPFTILKPDDLQSYSISCDECFRSKWANLYEKKFGQIRGGAQPVMYKDGFLNMAHSSFKNESGKLVYNPCFYKFEKNYPFEITHEPVSPFYINVPEIDSFKLPKLNKKAGSVIYPCGILISEFDAIISFGINDECCAIVKVSLSDIEKTMQEIVREEKGNLSEKNGIDTGCEINTPKDVGCLSKKDMDLEPLPLFWWNAKGKKFDHFGGDRKFEVGNVGDIASKILVENISGYKVKDSSLSENKLLAIGSILQNASNGDVIWGAGVKGGIGGFKKEVNHLIVHAVRGPLTVDFLKKNKIDISCIKELFDPGCLLALFCSKEINKNKNKKFIIIPHYRDDYTLRKRYPQFKNSFLSVDMMPLDFIKCIQDAESVISSSLHGIIFAESLGIPAKWLSTINGEDELKYYDYYFGTDRYNVKRFITIDSALKSEPMELPKFRFEEYIKTFPKNIKRELRGDLFNQSNSCFDQAFGWYRESSENLGIASYYSTKSLILFRGDKYFDGLYNLFLACKSYRNCSYFLDSDIIGGINRISSFYLGLGGFYDFSNSVISKFEVKYQNYSRFNFVVNFIHSFFDEMSQNERNLDLVKLLNAVKKMAQFKSVDIDCEWLVVMAYLNNIKGDKELEVGFLREAYSKDEKRFWEFYEVVYRFMYPVPELFNFLTCEGDESDEKKHNFFPRIQ